MVSGTLTWNKNGTLQQDNISDGYNSADTQDCTYVYDDFMRVASVNCLNGSTKIWNESYTYGSDAFGNLSKSTTGPGFSWMPGYNTANNHYTLAGTTYDANGSLLTDTFHTYTWLADGHVASIGTATITYDANGNKVEENIGGTIHEYVSAFGVSAQMTGQTQNATGVDLPGGVQALYSGGTLQRFRFPDWQGTIRAESNPATRVFSESLAFDPFGERYAVKGAPYNTDSFTGKPDQIVSDEYDFPARELHDGQSRWISPDPMRGEGNKYVYADNNPLSKVDLTGLTTVSYVVNGLEEGVEEIDGMGLSGMASESHPATSAQTAAEAQFICNNTDCTAPSAQRSLQAMGLVPAEPATAQGQQQAQTAQAQAQGQPAAQNQKTDDPKNLQLVPKTDSGSDHQPYREIQYQLETKKGDAPNQNWYVTEQQTNTTLAPNGTSTGNKPNGFKDSIGGNGPADSKQTFWISTTSGKKEFQTFVHTGAGDYGEIAIHIQHSGNQPAKPTEGATTNGYFSWPGATVVHYDWPGPHP